MQHFFQLLKGIPLYMILKVLEGTLKWLEVKSVLCDEMIGITRALLPTSHKKKMIGITSCYRGILEIKNYGFAAPYR